ncbi:MAG: thiamine biosynthesis protein ApbE [Hydrogenophilales bacterium 16-64-46]|nr:MAG: thiamine biosynthesis protein ApbE [Hydrogenophilales bacterium 12-64-13]OYZ07051.1 MAG: thiamine biosynthesis protein ApbE [Hydrogenophilales bacterium 16-64-46]OZA37759.1 MAG: thiamine biosynthesis protein ApbE [Hydrogenophilales bacterium 17-64-34]HQS99290.1 FAD:protein FMN transferase [Thiobacillus sp.]
MRRALAFLCVLLLASCAREPDIVKQQAYVFGTLVEVSVVNAPGAELAIAEVLARFDALHRQLHAWQPSELSRLNTALARGESMTVSPGLATLLTDAQALAAQSDELFNPAIGGLIALWGFHADTPQGRVPDRQILTDQVAQQPRMAQLVVAGTRVSSINPAVQLDLGGYAKGAALDQAAAILKRHGIANALVNIGGNVLALGEAGSRPWRVGIQHPRKPGVLATLELADGEALGTSGDYQRYFEAAGRRYCHLIDPRTGWPAKDMQSVTILVQGTRAGTRSDALSKPLFIDGAGHLASRARALGIDTWLAVDAAGKLLISPAMQARLR